MPGARDAHGTPEPTPSTPRQQRHLPHSPICTQLPPCSGKNGAPLLLAGAAALAAALGGGAYWLTSHPSAAPLLLAIKEYLASSVLAKSGFFAAFRCVLLGVVGCCC